MMYNNLDKPLYDAEATTRFLNDIVPFIQRPSPHGTTLTDLSAESGSSAAPTPVYKVAANLPSDSKEEEIFKDMIKNWIVSSSDELDSASSPRPAEESQNASSQEITNPQVSFLGLDPGPTTPFPILDAIPPFDFSSLDFSSTTIIPQLPFDPLTSFPLPSFDTAVGITPSSAAQPLPHVSQSVLHQAPSIAPSHKAQEDVAPRRSTVLSSILISSDVSSKCPSVRSTHMKGPKSILGKRSERDEDEGSKQSPPLSGSRTIKRRKLLPSYPLLPASSGSNTVDQAPFSLDFASHVPTATFPPPLFDTSLGNFPIFSPLLDPSLSLSQFLLHGSFYNSQPVEFPNMDGLNAPPDYLNLQASVNQSENSSTLSILTAGPPTGNLSAQLSSKTPANVPLVNIENRSILKRTPSLASTPAYDTGLPFVYDHRANPVRNHHDAMRVMFGTHSLTRGERDAIDHISGEQRRLIIERKVECDAAGGTRRRR